MKKTTLTETVRRKSQSFFDESNGGAQEIARGGDNYALEFNAPHREARILDAMLAAIKFAFLFVPGAFAASFATLGFIVFSFKSEIAVEIVVGTLGFIAAGTFMMMFGVGKLRDLRYLKMVGAILLLAVLESILYFVFALAISGDYFGAFLLAACLLNVFVSFVVKRHIDRAEV